jgi:two-component system, cell cycle sensor histidine kinase DivJ
MMEPQAQERGVSVTTRIPATVGEVAADQRAVQQILINLISNAVKFTPTGGWVRVTASRSGGVVRLRINDNGIGIEAKDLGKLCQPFMQVQNDYTRQFQGTGLGLSLVKGLVKLHGGEMTIDSAPGIGTAVTVSLPDATANENDWNQPVANDGPKGDHDQTEEARERRQDGVTLRKIA